jgi:hypothetical protein
MRSFAMATRPTDDQFAYVLTPSEPAPVSSSQKISGGGSASNGTGGVSTDAGSGGCTVCKGSAVSPLETVQTTAVAPPTGGLDGGNDAGSGGCTVCHIQAAFDPAVGQVSITLPQGEAPAIQSAAVITRSGDQMQHYDVDTTALRSLLLNGRVDWYLPATTPKPTSVVVTFRLEGEADDAPTHDVTAL